MLPRDVPEDPWQDLAADFFHHNNTEYLLIADTFSNYPLLYKTSSKAVEPITQRIKSPILQYRPPKTLSTDNGPPLSSEAFAKFMQKENIDHIASSPHYPQSNGFMEHQIKAIKTALSTCQEAKQSIEDLLLNIRSQPIGTHLPFPREILYNITEECHRRPSYPTDMEHICNYPISKKTTQKENHNRSHNIRTLSDIIPGQMVLFLSPADPYQYIEGAITSHASTPRGYIIESQDRNNCCTCQCIHQLHTPISRLSTSKDPILTISRPSATEQPDSPIKSKIPRPSAATQPVLWVNPTISRPSMPKHIPAPCHKFHARPPEQESVCTTPAHTTTNLNQVITHITAINQPHTTTMTAQPDPVPKDQVPESSPSSPATSISTSSESEDTSSDVKTSNDTQSTSNNSSLASTMSDRQLRPRYPINYNKKLLQNYMEHHK